MIIVLVDIQSGEEVTRYVGEVIPGIKETVTIDKPDHAVVYEVVSVDHLVKQSDMNYQERTICIAKEMH